MTEQMSFLEPEPPAQRHSETSKAAASAIVPKVQSLRLKVLEYLQHRPVRGCTDAEIQKGLGMDPSTERPRRIELVKAGHVVDSGKRRKTPSGKLAVVWICPESKP